METATCEEWENMVGKMIEGGARGGGLEGVEEAQVVLDGLRQCSHVSSRR